MPAAGGGKRMKAGRRLVLRWLAAAALLFSFLPAGAGRGAGSQAGKIAELKKAIPRFYEIYCTEETAAPLAGTLAELGEADPADAGKSAELLEALAEGLGGLQFRWDSAVPRVYLATDDGSGASFGTRLDKSHDYVAAQITVVDEEGRVIACDTGWGGKVRIRGNTTSQGDKKPYNIRFAEKTDLFGMGASRKWVLLADLYDPTLMRNYLALDFGKRLGLASTPDFRRVEVWMDGVCQGLYLLTEKIDAGQLGLSTKNRSGDFLVEMVFAGTQEGDNIYFSTASGKYFRLREPEGASELLQKWIAEQLDQFEALLASGDWKKVSRMIDVDSFVAWYIQNEFFKTTDFADTSVYLHCRDGRYYGGPGWDFDLSAGNCNPEVYGEELPSYEGALAAEAHYFKYLMKYPEFRREVLRKYLEAREYLAETVKPGGLLDQQCERFREPLERNNARWFKGAESYIVWQKTPESTYEENIESLRAWMKQRELWLTDYLTSLAAGE